MELIRRREFLTLIGSAAATWPLAARAQQVSRNLRIGILETIPASANAANLEALRLGLKELGYVEGQNLTLDYRSADGHDERFADLAKSLVDSNVDLIVTRGTPAVLAAKNSTQTLPIVMAAIGEPLIAVGAIAHPGGNVTGLSAFVTDLQAKRVELLKNMAPGIVRIAALMNMGNPVLPPQWKQIESAARSLGLSSQLLDVRKGDDVNAAFDIASRDHVDAIVVGIDALTQTYRQTIAQLALDHRLPSIYASREFVKVGGLMTYGPSYPDLYRRAAAYVDKIVKGARPGDLPVEQPTKFDLVINLKTAKRIDITVPQTLLVAADEVIE
jgi:putative ABC transport system substrate-binding protein